jgi:peptidoglycan-N-acetylglucosamine deacetylase
LGNPTIAGSTRTFNNGFRHPEVGGAGFARPGMFAAMSSSETARSLDWRGADTAAVAWLTFDVDAEAPILAEGRRYAAQPMVMSHQAYGPEVGVPRLLAVLEEFALPATFFVPGLTAERHPAAVEAILAAGHEVAHHSYSHRIPSDLDEEEERRDFELGLAALRALGADVRGYRAPLSSASFRTAGLLAEHGLRYESTLMDDDSPYVLETEQGSIAELPPYFGLDDWLQYAYLPSPEIGHRVKSPEQVVPMWCAELDAARHYGCLFTLTVHPFVSGRPSRIEALREFLAHAKQVDGVAFARGDQLAERVLADEALPRRRLSALALEPDPEVYPNE